MNNSSNNNCKLDHLKYEIDMFSALAKTLSLGSLALDMFGSIVVKNALLESFLLHERNIIDFLYGETKYKTDITYKDFLKNRTEPFINEGIREDRERNIDKEILHLTEIRCEQEKTKWNVLSEYCFLAEYIKKCIDEIEKTEIDDNGKKILEEIKSEVSNLQNLCKNESIKDTTPPTTTSNVEATSGMPDASKTSQHAEANP